MFPDAKWLDALKLPLKATLAIALASSVLLLLHAKGALDLGSMNSFVRPTLIIALVISIALAVVGLIDLLFAPVREKRKRSALADRRAARKLEEDANVAEQRAQALAALDHLSQRELYFVGQCLRDGSPSFFTYVHSPPVALLQGKLLVWTPGGQHHQDHYPFCFYDFAWAELLRRKDEFLAKAPKDF